MSLTHLWHLGSSNQQQIRQSLLFVYSMHCKQKLLVGKMMEALLCKTDIWAGITIYYI